MQVGESRISSFLEKKFRLSKSHFTKYAYRLVLKSFAKFLQEKYNSDVNDILEKIAKKEIDALDVLDDYYTYMTVSKKSDGNSYRSATIVNYVITAKEFLNSQGCKVYKEDMQQRFRLPKVTKVYEKGLTKETINRILRFANPKLATVVLIACSGGMRIAEIMQLRISDIDFTTTPTTIVIRADTTKTRETRITHITSEATSSLKDYIAKEKITSNDAYLFLVTPEERLCLLKERLAKNDYTKSSFRIKDENRLPMLESQIKNTPKDEQHANSVKVSRHNLETQLYRILKSIPDLNTKNENGRNAIHFHAFRAWFKTQVTDAHQSDFAEALMGHKSLKLVYYRQNDKARAKTYLEIEHALTIGDSELMDENYSDLQKDNNNLRKLVDLLSRKLRNLEEKK